MLTKVDFSDKFEVVFEDNHLIIVNKRSGILVQGDETGDKALPDYIKDYLRAKYNKPGNIFAGVVHRLDRPVSGLVVIAKTSKALERMNEIFRERKVEKVYWAIVGNKPPELSGKLVHWMKKDGKINVSRTYDNQIKDSLRAELDYQMVGKSGELYLLEVNPHTGRHHQIRSQLSSMGCPIKGDVKYGFSEKNGDHSICLHARRLKFIHPVKKEPIELIADLPGSGAWGKFKMFE